MTRDIDIGDAVETLFTILLVGSYVYAHFAYGYRIEDPFIEALLFAAASSLFGHKFLEYTDRDP